MKSTYIHLLFVLCLFSILPVQAADHDHLHYFDLQDVKLMPSPFQHAETLDKKYLLELKADRLLAPYLKEAGLQPKDDNYSNWENTGLDGHIGGHYVSALAMMWAATGDQEIKARLDYMLSELKRCQDAGGTGYLSGVPGGKSMWEAIARGEIRAGSFDLNGKWVPLYNIHKIYAGLRDAYLHANSEVALEMLVKLTDWAIRLVEGLSDEQLQDMLRSEHGGLNEVFADVAAITGNEKYLDLAVRFSQRAILDPLLKGEDHLTGMHANTQIPKVIGYQRIAELKQDESWNAAARFFWEKVVTERSVSIGGNSAYEHFHPTHDFTRMMHGTEGPETCNTYNMMRLSRQLFAGSTELKYIDYYERALYNHILSSQHPETGGLVYFTQMRPGHYRVYSQPQTSFWCCVGSGIENHAKYGEMIYAYDEKALWVNLFIPSRLEWKERKMVVIQENNFPDQAFTDLVIQPERRQKMTLRIRKPEWSNSLRLELNGKSVRFKDDGSGYVEISKRWKKNDRLRIHFDMQVVADQLPDSSAYYSFRYGPIVLAAVWSKEELTGLYADDSRGGHIAHGTPVPMRDIPVLVSDPDKVAEKLTVVSRKPLTFRLNGLIPDEFAKGMELIPFFRLHDSRYIIYWPQATAEEAQALLAKRAADEQVIMRLDALTIDKVNCGEQQPESDHFIQSERSGIGFSEDLHWREARGWFSYQLRNPDQSARYLRIVHFDASRARRFKLLLNGQELKEFELRGGDDNKVLTTIIEIPTELQLNTQLDFRVEAQQGSITARLVEVRLLDAQSE